MAITTQKINSEVEPQPQNFFSRLNLGTYLKDFNLANQERNISWDSKLDAFQKLQGRFFF